MIKNKWFQMLVVAGVAFSVGKFSSNIKSQKTENTKQTESSTQKNDVVIKRETLRPDGTRIITTRVDKTQKENSSKLESKKTEIVTETRPKFMIGYSYGTRHQTHGVQVQRRIFGETYLGGQIQFGSQGDLLVIFSTGF